MEIGVFFEFQLGVSATLASLQIVTNCIITNDWCTANEENSLHRLECIVVLHVRVLPSEWKIML